MELATLTESIDRLVATDPAELARPDEVVALYAQLSRLEAVVTSVTAAFEASEAWQLDGARNVAAWLATRCSLPRGHARRRVGLARVLRELPECSRAWHAGEVPGATIEMIAGLASPATKDALARDEALLVGEARRLSFAAFSRVCRYWSQLADPDGAEQDAEERRARRDVWLRRSFDGCFLGRITLDEIAGTIVSGELARLEHELFVSDWSQARERLGRTPLRVELARTSAERRADALLEMASRSGAASTRLRRRPLFTVLVDYPTLAGRVCELANATVVTPGSLVSYLGQADIERAVFGPDGRVEVGRKARLYTGATRRALELRRRECAHPYCEEPAEICQGDHVERFADGGPTTQENGRLLCGYHNRLRERSRNGPLRRGHPPPGEAA